MAVLGTAGVLLVAPAARASTYLTYTLSDSLKKTSCSGDTDSDCLDNGREADLAWVASPNYFWDEDEGCHSGQHFDMWDFYQVRPVQSLPGHVSTWANDSSWKTVIITYYLNYPHDCNQWSGHQGDNEKVEIWMQSQDLVTWSLTYARMYHHYTADDYLGSWISLNSANIGTAYMNVAYDEDGHGSWPGLVYSSSDCDTGSRMSTAGCNIFGCDCFQNGSMSSSLNNGQFMWLDVTRNIGGPWPETWNTAQMTNDGTGNFYSVVDTGHGSSNREYWTPKGGAFSRFCGWECPLGWRGSDGHCTVDAHDNHTCTDPLSNKVNGYFFEY